MAQRLIWIAAVYLILGPAIGIYMGINHNFALTPVHAHVLLVGWLSLAVAGIIYRLYPAAGTTRLAKVHFWLHILGLPVFVLSLAALLTGHHPGIVLMIGAFSLYAGLLCFSLNVWLHVRDSVK